MARKDRTGNRKPREQRPPVKVPELLDHYSLKQTRFAAASRKHFTTNWLFE